MNRCSQGPCLSLMVYLLGFLLCCSGEDQSVSQPKDVTDSLKELSHSKTASKSQNTSTKETDTSDVYTCKGTHSVLYIKGPKAASIGFGTLVIQYPRATTSCIDKLYINGVLKKSDPCSKHKLKSGTYEVVWESLTFKTSHKTRIKIQNNKSILYPFIATRCDPDVCHKGHKCPMD